MILLTINIAFLLWFIGGLVWGIVIGITIMIILRSWKSNSKQTLPGNPNPPPVPPSYVAWDEGEYPEYRDMRSKPKER